MIEWLSEPPVYYEKMPSEQ